ncbi:hypothetical protein NHG32_06415 [Aerococcaceae bacterium NML191219]|nr:hypothetical protein [Aerococcaceae bacterium NML191219]
MDKLKQLIQLLKNFDVPFAYHHFAEGEAVGPPFIIYLLPKRHDFKADGKNYYKVTEVRLELYTDQKDIHLENRLETALDKVGFVYEKEEVWIESEKLYEVIFTFDMEVY